MPQHNRQQVRRIFYLVNQVTEVERLILEAFEYVALVWKAETTGAFDYDGSVGVGSGFDCELICCVELEKGIHA